MNASPMTSAALLAFLPLVPDPEGIFRSAGSGAPSVRIVEGGASGAVTPMGRPYVRMGPEDLLRIRAASPLQDARTKGSP